MAIIAHRGAALCYAAVSRPRSVMTKSTRQSVNAPFDSRTLDEPARCHSKVTKGLLLGSPPSAILMGILGIHTSMCASRYWNCGLLFVAVRYMGEFQPFS